MNSEKLLDIINCILTDENIYELFKNHGYNESFENLQKDLTNLLDKFTATDDELSNVAGGKSNIYTKISSGILASIASFSGMNFVGAQTLKEEQSKSQRVLNNIKENGVNSAKKAAKFVVNNGGKIAGVGSLLVTWSLLCALIGRYTKEVPVVDTKDMAEDETKLIEFARGVLDKIYTDINIGSKRYFNSDKENYDSLQELINGSENIGGIQKISGDVKVGHLVKELLPEREENRTQAYIEGREKLIKYENELITLAKTLITKHSNANVETLKQEIQKLKKESDQQKKQLKDVETAKEELNKEMKSKETEHKQKLDEIEKEKAEIKGQLEQISGEKETMEKNLKDLQKENEEQKTDLKKVEEEKEQLQEQIETAEVKHTKQITALEKNKEALTDQLKQVSDEKEKMEKALKDLQKENKQKEEDSKKKDLALNAKDKEIDELKTEKENLKTQLRNEKKNHDEREKKIEENFLDQKKQLEEKLAEQVENVSLTKWNGTGEGCLADLTSEDKTKKLTEWINSSGTLMTDEILQFAGKFLLDDARLFNVPRKIPDSYKNSILGSQAVGWKYEIYHKPADSLDSNQLRINFVDKKLWMKLFEALEQSTTPTDVDLVFVLFQACRLAGWPFVPETICKALVEHYEICEKTSTEYNRKLRIRINQLLDSCGLKLEYNGVYLKNAGNQKPPVF